MAEVSYKSFAYQFEPLAHIALTSNIYANIELLLNSEQPYWIHFEKPSKNLQQQIAKKFNLSKHARIVMFADESRSRCLRVDDGIVLIMQGVQPSSMVADENFPTLRFLFTKNGIISISTGKIEAIKDLQSFIKSMNDPTPMKCFLYIIEAMMEYLEESIYQIDEALNKVEEKFDHTEEASRSIASIRQDIIFLRRYVVPQRDILNSLIGKLEINTKIIKTQLKEHSQTMLRQVESIEMLRERATIIQDSLTNQIAEVANRRMYLLTIIMLIFTPAFFIMSMFSMYLPIPGMDSRYTWWLVELAIVVVSYSLYRLFKMKNWL